MAIINGTKIGTTNISGRDVGILLREKPFPYLYPDGVTRMSYDLWQLCNSDNINKFCKFRPGQDIGLHNTFNVGESRILEEAVKIKCTVNKPDLSHYGANLAHFGGYDDTCYLPIKTFFPEKIGLDSDNVFYFQYMNMSTHKPANFSFTDIYGKQVGNKQLYNGVLIINKTINKSARFQSPVTMDDNLPTNEVLCKFQSGIHYDWKSGHDLEVHLYISDNPDPDSIDVTTYFSMNWSDYGYPSMKTYKLEQGGTGDEDLTNKIIIYAQDPFVQLEQFSCGKIELSSTLNRNVTLNYYLRIEVIYNGEIKEYWEVNRGSIELLANMGNRGLVADNYYISVVYPPYNDLAHMYFTLYSSVDGKLLTRTNALQMRGLSI